MDKMLDDGVSPNTVAKWLNENGFEISVPTVYKYAERRRKEIVTDIKASILAGQEIEKPTPEDEPEFGTNILPLYTREGLQLPVQPKKKLTPIYKPGEIRRENPFSQIPQKDRKIAKYRVKSDLEMLDAIIDKGWETLQDIEYVPPQVVIQAIKLKHEITGGAHGGLTVHGLEEIRVREQAREEAMLQVLLKFIPEELHDAVLNNMEDVTREFYDSIGLGEEYDRMMEMEENKLAK